MSPSPGDANRLAAIIRAYWKRQGLCPAVRVEQEEAQASPTATGRTLWVVRSDMMGGMPRPVTTVPAIVPKIVSGLTPEASSPFAGLAAIRQRLEAQSAVRASRAVYGEEAGFHG